MLVLDDLLTRNFERDNMNGGLTRHWPGCHVMVTGGDGCDQPDDDDWMVGFYVDADEGEPHAMFYSTDHAWEDVLDLIDAMPTLPAADPHPTSWAAAL